MAKITSGLFRTLGITGTIGDMTIRKTKDGYIVAQKSSIDKDRIRKSPEFVRTRENNADFTTVTKAASFLVRLFRAQFPHCSTQLHGPAVKLLYRIIKEDQVNMRGTRQLTQGPLGLLEGFNFNTNAKLEDVFQENFVVSVTRSKGLVNCSIPQFLPFARLQVPGGTTHFRFTFQAAAVDFGKLSAENDFVTSTYLPFNASFTKAMGLNVPIPRKTTKPVICVLGIEFFQCVQAQYYPVSTHQHTCSIVHVDQ